MPLSSNHEKWPVDVVGCAVTMMRIATAKWKIGYKQSGERRGGAVDKACTKRANAGGT